MTAPNSCPRVAQHLTGVVINLRRERPFAHARHIRLRHADHRPDPRRAHACPGRRAARRRRGRRHKRIGPVVDVQHRALRAFEHHALALGSALFSRRAVSVTNGRIFSAAAAYSSYICAGSSGSVPNSAWAMAFFSRQAFSMCVFSRSPVQQIDHPQPVARHLVFVGRTNATAGRADLLPPGALSAASSIMR